MAYRVNVTARAQRDLASLFHEINAEHSAAALKSYQGLEEPILNPEMVTPAAHGTYHVVLEVRDAGTPPLTAYRRAVLRVR